MNAAADADEEGFSLPAQPTQVLDAYFDDQRVFSLAPRSFTRRGDRFHAPWPKNLRPLLDGHTHFVVKEHLTGVVVLDLQLQLGASPDRISVRDRNGRPLAVDKFGALVRMFSDTDRSTAQHLASEVARLAADVNAFGVTGFLAYGSLLGAVRDGHLIGHDTDADMAYLSRYAHPADLARESFALERFLAGRGWEMRRMRVGLVRAVFTDREGDLRHIDIFVATHDGERIFLDPFVWAELPRSALLPLGTVRLEGVEIPAPADPGAVLAATYGPSYLVPDPAFKYRRPRPLRRASDAWFGNYRRHRAAWQRRLRVPGPGALPSPSAFARRVAEEEPSASAFVDVGCGAGVDALWLARNGRRVLGLDYAQPMLARLRERAEVEGLPAEFRWVSLYDLRTTLATAAELAGELDEPVLLARNLLDVLEPEGRHNFWLLARAALLRGGRLHLSFRTREAAGHADEPGFRPLRADRVEAEATARGAHVVRRQDRRGSVVLVLAWT